MNIFTFIFLVGFLFETFALEQTTVKPKVASCGITNGGPIIQQITRPISFPGGLFWSTREQKIAFVDLYDPAICRYTLDGIFNRMPMSEGKIYTSIFPIKDAPGLQFVVGVDRKLIYVNVTGSGLNLNYTSKNLLTITNNPESRLVKGKIDKEGTLWYTVTSGIPGYDGRLYKVKNLQTPVVMQDNLQSPGGMGWSKDYKHFYLVDIIIGIIYRFEFNSAQGTIKNRQIVFNIDVHRNISGIIGDIVVDEDENLWIGLYQSGSVVHYNPNTRKILQIVSIPAQDVGALEFGGPYLKTLFVSSTYLYLAEPKLQPAAGSLFAISGLGVTGIEDNEIFVSQQLY